LKGGERLFVIEITCVAQIELMTAMGHMSRHKQSSSIASSARASNAFGSMPAAAWPITT